MKRQRRVWLGILLVWGGFVLSMTAHTQVTPDQGKVKLTIASKAMGDALNEFGQQSGLHVVLFSELGAGLITPAIEGAFTPSEALDRLLANTGLRYKYLDKQTVAVLSEKDERVRASQQSRQGSEDMQLVQNATSTTADSSTNQDSLDSPEPSAGDLKRDTVDQIVVTAQKREERLQDVPGAVSAISGERLEAMNVNSLADLANYVPGIAVSGIGAPGARTVVIRGLNTSYNNDAVAATVATYIDDMPISAGRGAQYGVDIQPYDIERIEFLKGPQGTLYGANTLGGLVKYVLRKPNLTQFEARVGSEMGYVDGSGGADWAVRGSVDVPLVVSKLGVRVGGFSKHDEGYIDNIGTGVKDVNGSTQKGGRAALLWQATEHLAVRATILAEDVDVRNIAEVTIDAATQQPLYGPQVVSTRFPEPFKLQTRYYALGADWDLGFATLTSASGWSKMEWNRAWDLTVPYGSFCQPGALGPGWSGCPDYPFADALALFGMGMDVSKFVQEVRLISPEDQRIQWMLGGFYTKETSNFYARTPTFTSAGVPLPDANKLLDYSPAPEGVGKEAAAFVNVTYQFTDRFDVSGGIRHSEYTNRSSGGAGTGLFYGGGSGFPLSGSRLPSVGVTTWMANARFHPSQDAMLYARVATGYRPGYGCKFNDDGSPCGLPALGVPGFVDPDWTTNYETGFKGQFFDRRLQLDVAMFYIDWTDIQISTVATSGLIYAGNGGKASSKGVEFATSYQVTQGLRLNTTLTYTDAQLEKDAPGVGGEAGDQLPVAPRWTGSLTADYTRPLDERKSLLMGGGYRHRDAVVNLFSGSGFTQSYTAPMGPQNIVDLYTGLTIDDLTIRLYGSNVFNNRSYTGLNFMNDPTRPNFIPIQPRTVRLSVDYQF